MVHLLAARSVLTQQLCVLVAVSVVAVHEGHSLQFNVLDVDVWLLLQAGGSWRSKPPEPQPDDDRRGMRLAYVGISPHSLCDSLRRNLFTVVTSLWADLFLISHCAKMLISFTLVLFVGTVGATVTQCCTYIPYILQIWLVEFLYMYP
jgi:hypothetical protein